MSDIKKLPDGNKENPRQSAPDWNGLLDTFADKISRKVEDVMVRLNELGEEENWDDITQKASDKINQLVDKIDTAEKQEQAFQTLEGTIKKKICRFAGVEEDEHKSWEELGGLVDHSVYDKIKEFVDHMETEKTDQNDSDDQE